MEGSHLRFHMTEWHRLCLSAFAALAPGRRRGFCRGRVSPHPARTGAVAVPAQARRVDAVDDPPQARRDRQQREEAPTGKLAPRGEAGAPCARRLRAASARWREAPATSRAAGRSQRLHRRPYGDLCHRFIPTHGPRRDVDVSRSIRTAATRLEPDVARVDEGSPHPASGGDDGLRPVRRAFRARVLQGPLVRARCESWRFLGHDRAVRRRSAGAAVSAVVGAMKCALVVWAVPIDTGVGPAVRAPGQRAACEGIFTASQAKNPCRNHCRGACSSR